MCRKSYTPTSGCQSYCGGQKVEGSCSYRRYHDLNPIRRKESYNRLKKKEGFLEKNRDRHYKWKYNLTSEEYTNKLNEQNGVCGVCGSMEFFFKRILAVDHDHTTGKVRGLLCNKCNLGLGNFKDSIETLKSAIKY